MAPTLHQAYIKFILLAGITMNLYKIHEQTYKIYTIKATFINICVHKIQIWLADKHVFVGA